MHKSPLLRSNDAGSLRIASLDVWAKGVREVVASCLPDGFSINFAETYDADDQMALAADSDVILTGWAAVTAEMITASPRLRIIQKWGIGLDRLDLVAAREAGVAVSITSGANASVVAEHALMMMLAVYRRLSMVDHATREGRWLFDQMRGVCRQLSGKTVGLVGFGHIGRMLAAKLASMGVVVVYTDLKRCDEQEERRLNVRFVDFDDLVQVADVISIHIPGGKNNEKLFDAKILASMKPGSILVNVSRGDIVDEAALVAAIKSGHLMGAGLDVFEEEPPSPGSEILTLPEVVLSAHTAGSVIDNVQNVAQHAFGNIVKLLAGEPIAPVDQVLPLGQQRSAIG